LLKDRFHSLTFGHDIWGAIPLEPARLCCARESGFDRKNFIRKLQKVKFDDPQPAFPVI
jgi:hypothetical protein